MKTAVFLQTRLDSSRLPYKALYDLSGKALVSRCMEALQDIKADLRVLLCDEASFSSLQGFAKDEGWEIFSGSKEHVLERFVRAAEYYGVSHLYRATGDNPLVSSLLSETLFRKMLDQAFDYAGYSGVPIGSSCECARVQALKQVLESGPSAYEREHVCPGLYQHPELYRCLKLEAPPWARNAEASFTLDTFEDYQRLNRLFADSGQGTRPYFESYYPYPG